MQVITQVHPKISALNFSSLLTWKLKIQEDKLRKEPNKYLKLLMPITQLLILNKYTCHLKESVKSFWEKISSSKIKEELIVKILPYLALRPEPEWSYLTLYLS